MATLTSEPVTLELAPISDPISWTAIAPTSITFDQWGIAASDVRDLPAWLNGTHPCRFRLTIPTAKGSVCWRACASAAYNPISRRLTLVVIDELIAGLSLEPFAEVP